MDAVGQPRIRSGYLFWKRAMDLLGALIALAVLWLPMLICFLLVRMTSPGAAIFRQERVGRDGRLFVCYKFRTMRRDAPSHRPAAEFSDRERYLTPVGSFLRRTSLDELPQLWNILKGEMSFVGPRPLIPQEREVHRLRQLSGADRLRPGLTGLAQVRGRTLLSDPQKAALDARYTQTVSLRQDLRILGKTLLSILFSAETAAVQPKKLS